MNKLFLSAILLLIVVFLACERKPHVTHKVKLENAGEDCSVLQNYFRMNSNFGGERYEFEKCLPSDFTEKQVVSERRGDTVVVRFKPSAAKGNNLFRITLDIDSYPLYKFLTIDEDTYTITPSEK